MAKSIVKNGKLDVTPDLDEDVPFWRNPYFPAAVIGLIIVLGALAYCNSFWAPFVLDDPDQIANNPGIRQLWPIWDIFTFGGQMTRPLVYLSLAINYAISEYKVWSYHLFNLGIHLIAAMTLYGLVRRTLLAPRLKERFENHAHLLAAIITLIWLVHPMLSSAVTYVIQRAESMMGLAYFLTLYFAVRAIGDPKPYKWFIPAVLACSAGMGCKQIMVTAPLMVLVYDWAFGEYSSRERWRLGIYFVLVGMTAGLVIGRPIINGMLHLSPTSVLPFVAAPLPVMWILVDLAAKKLSVEFRRRIWLYASLPLSYVLLAMSMNVTPMNDTAGFQMNTMTWWQYALTEIGVHLTYLKLSLVPYPLCLDYELPTVKTLGEVSWPGAIILAGLLGLTVWALFRRRELGFLGVWYFLVLAPSSSFMPIKDKIFEFRVYVSMVALISLLVLAAYRLGPRLFAHLKDDSPNLPKLQLHLTAGVWAICLTLLLCAVWAALFAWDAAPAVSPLYVVPPLLVLMYGLSLLTFHQEDASVRRLMRTVGVGSAAAIVLGFTTMTILRNYDYRGEEELWRQTLSLRPDNPRAHSNLGVVLLLKGKPIEEGMFHLFESVRVSDGTFCDAIYNIAVMYGKRNMPVESLEWYRKCLKVDPKYLNARHNLAVALQEMGYIDDAVVEYRLVLKQEPGHVGALNNLGVILNARGQYKEAYPLLKQASQVDPGNPQTLANLLDVCRKLGMVDEANSIIKRLDMMRGRGMGQAMPVAPSYKN